MYSKKHEKGSLSKFKKSVYGEAIIEFNDNPHTTLGVDNVFVFVKGTKNEPKITRVVRVNAIDEITIDFFRKDIYENTGYSTLEAYTQVVGKEYIRYYTRNNSANYGEYSRRTRTHRSRSESGRNTFDTQNGNQRRGTLEKNRADEIEQRKKTSSTDGVFFDANKKAYSLWGTLIVVGNSKYSAEVVVGITVAGDAVLYDVVSMTTVAFNIKKAEFSTTATTQNAIGDINENSTNTIISPNTPTVNKQLSLSEDNSGDVVDEVVCFRGGISPPAVLTNVLHQCNWNKSYFPS